MSLVKHMFEKSGIPQRKYIFDNFAEDFRKDYATVYKDDIKSA